MKRICLIISVSICVFATAHINAQDVEAEVTQLLNRQAEAWNNGDLHQFMMGYHASDKLQFLGSAGLTEGWDEVLQRYIEKYPDKAAMGVLTFDLQRITPRTNDICTVIGTYHLDREAEGHAQGNFLLVVQRIGSEWKIIADSTH